jgi:hypothetical protein
LWRARRLAWRRRLGSKRPQDEAGTSAIEFYERLTNLLAARGLKRETNQTPLEFAVGVGLNEAVSITQAYNRVRFGGEDLSAEEQHQLEHALDNLKGEIE